MTEILAPTRQQLAEFIRNHETIRRFEINFRMVGEDLPDAIAGVSETAGAGINNLLGLFEALSQESAVNDAAIESKINAATGRIKTLQESVEENEFLMQTMSLLC